MRKVFFFLFFTLSLSVELLAQVGKEKVSFGKESAKGVVNVAALAKFLEEHPSKIMRRMPMKEEEEVDENTVMPEEGDPSLVRTLKRDPAFRLITDESTPALMPISVNPTDTFLGITSVGSN